MLFRTLGRDSPPRRRRRIGAARSLRKIFAHDTAFRNSGVFSPRRKKKIISIFSGTFLLSFRQPSFFPSLRFSLCLSLLLSFSLADFQRSIRYLAFIRVSEKSKSTFGPVSSDAKRCRNIVERCIRLASPVVSHYAPSPPPRSGEGPFFRSLSRRHPIVVTVSHGREVATAKSEIRRSFQMHFSLSLPVFLSLSLAPLRRKSALSSACRRNSGESRSRERRQR